MSKEEGSILRQIAKMKAKLIEKALIQHGITDMNQYWDIEIRTELGSHLVERYYYKGKHIVSIAIKTEGNTLKVVAEPPK